MKSSAYSMGASTDTMSSGNTGSWNSNNNNNNNKKNWDSMDGEWGECTFSTGKWGVCSWDSGKLKDCRLGKVATGGMGLHKYCDFGNGTVGACTMQNNGTWGNCTTEQESDAPSVAAANDWGICSISNGTWGFCDVKNGVCKWGQSYMTEGWFPHNSILTIIEC
jgi:hypothetical protein